MKIDVGQIVLDFFHRFFVTNFPCVLMLLEKLLHLAERRAAFLCCLLALLIDLIGLQHTEHHGILLAGRELHMRKLRARR